MTIADVVFNLPLEKSFHYLIPSSLEQALQPGMRVIAPFGPREQTGIVLRRLAESPLAQLKAIRRVLDPEPVVTDERWALAEWVAKEYYCSLGEALFAMVPSALRMPKPAPSTDPSTPLPPGAAALALEPPLALTPLQQHVFTILTGMLDRSKAAFALLHGVTGSGKTELYLQAIHRVLQQGRSAMCLVPEIALTPQTIEWFQARFGSAVAVWHSRLTPRERSQAWANLAAGTRRIVVGTRSAVFAPLRQLGLIILDEEQEQSFKQQDAPRYHARDVACARAKLTGSLVLVGSATPSIESFYAASQPGGHLLNLPERIEGRPLPQVEVIDMREQLVNRRRMATFSGQLQRALEQAVERGDQVMLLLNRRGFARTAQCQTCAAVARCHRCSVPLVYHATEHRLVCHYCDYREPPPDICAECRKGSIRLRGAGTERVESELHRLFPVASIGRMDADTTRARHSHRAMYDAIKSQQIGVLVGTQMIAKGFDFPQVTLVGVVSADTSLNLPDFRAGERTFDLLTQMAGRAGRGQQPGRVLIQSYCPEHYAIQTASRQDYAEFYRQELAMRQRLMLPPFRRLIELTMRGSSQQQLQASADALAQALREQIKASGRAVALYGPAPHRIPRLRRSYQVCLLMKARRVEEMLEALRHTLQPGRKFRGLPVTVDVDPL